jgi:hypothetical protein
MLESFMEDLLWKYPDDFFPGKGFKQADRQFTLPGAGRGDISFRDSTERLWVIEVKAVPIRTEVADQVYRYAEALRVAHPELALIPAVVAPVINATVRGHFDRWGVEHFEISEATFRRVAAEQGMAAEPEQANAAGSPVRVSAAVRVATNFGTCGDGPVDGLYALVQNAPCRHASGRCYCADHVTWHYRIDGQTVCGAHSGAATATRTDCTYFAASTAPEERVCNKGCRAAARSAGPIAGA